MMKFSFLLALLLVLHPTASFLTPLSSRINVPASPKISNAKLAKTTNFVLNARGAKGGTKVSHGLGRSKWLLMLMCCGWEGGGGVDYGLDYSRIIEQARSAL